MSQENENVLHAFVHFGYDALGVYSVLASSGVELDSIVRDVPGEDGNILLRLVEGISDSEMFTAVGSSGVLPAVGALFVTREPGDPELRTFRLIAPNNPVAESPGCVSWWKITPQAPSPVAPAPPVPPPP